MAVLIKVINTAFYRDNIEQMENAGKVSATYNKEQCFTGKIRYNSVRCFSYFGALSSGVIMGIFDFFRQLPNKQDTMLDEFNAFVGDLKVKGALEPVQVNIALKNREYGYLEVPAKLYETRSVSYYRSSGRVGLRVMKGVYIGSGSSGRSESEQEWKVIDNGKIVITNTRIIFNGSSTNRIIPIDKIISMQQFVDGIGISSETRDKAMQFSVPNPYILIAVYELVSGTGNFGSVVRRALETQ